MMTNDTSVKRNVMLRVKRMVRPGQIVNKTMWRAAYAIERIDAIKRTILWKQTHITIEDTPNYE